MPLVKVSSKVSRARWLGWSAFLAPNFFSTNRQVENISISNVTRNNILSVLIPAFIIVILFFQSKRVPQKFGKSHAYLVLFLIWASCSSFWSDNFSISFAKSITLILQFMLSYMLVSQYSDIKEFFKDFSHFIQVLSILIMANLTVNFKESYALEKSGVKRLVEGTLHISSNTLATIFAISLIIVFFGTDEMKVFKTKFINTFLLGFYCIFLILTKSRLTILFTLSIIVLIILINRQLALNFRILFLISLVSILVVVYLSFFNFIIEFFTRSQNSISISTLSGRTNIWDQALSLWNESPWIGHGYYVGHRFNIREILGSRTEVSNLDNIWIESLIDVGFIGFLILFVFMVKTFKRLTKLLLLAEPGERYAIFGVGILLLISTTFNPSIQIACFQGGIFSALLLSGIGFNNRPN